VTHRHPLLRRTGRLGLLLPLLFAAGCFCPPKVERYGTPAETLATWQAQLCHDDLPGEYRCLSAGLQARMGGFETYYAARRKLLEEDPLAGWFLRHSDLAARASATDQSDDGLAALMSFEERGRPFRIGFVLETRAFFELTDGRRLSALQAGPIPAILRQQGTRQWLTLVTPPGLEPEDHLLIRTLRVEPQWKIDAIDGLTPDLREAP
jgi:hypothetical protein